MNKEGPKIRGECAALAPYFRYSFANCVILDNHTQGKHSCQLNSVCAKNCNVAA